MGFPARWTRVFIGAVSGKASLCQRVEGEAEAWRDVSRELICGNLSTWKKLVIAFWIVRHLG